MKDDKLNVVKAWFKKAENDLINAENTIKFVKMYRMRTVKGNK